MWLNPAFERQELDKGLFGMKAGVSQFLVHSNELSCPVSWGLLLLFFPRVCHWSDKLNTPSGSLALCWDTGPVGWETREQ